MQANMLEPFFDRHHRNNKRGEKHINGDKTFRIEYGTVGVKNEALGTEKDKVGKKAGDKGGDHPTANDALHGMPIDSFRANR